MSRLINADELIKYIPPEEPLSIFAVANAPTVDAVPVIRCCDCIHFEYFEDQFTQMTRCDVHNRCPDYTDFCSWAERKEE